MFEEEITVSLVSVVVRVVDRRGNPILGLAPEDFQVGIGRQELAIHSLDWVSSELVEAGMAPEPSGKLVVLFFQADHHAVRITGHLRMLPQVERLLEKLHRNDWAAVVSFDSRLKLHQDFTRDRRLPLRGCWNAVRRAAEPIVTPGPYPSLARHLNPEQTRRVASAERALELTAQALRSLHGEKVLVFLGWGLGRVGSSGFRLGTDYERAGEALREARVTVFVLDVTNADDHTLEIGLDHIAEDTGGTYAKTHLFASRAADELARTISGHYVLTFENSQVHLGDRKLKIELREKEGTVLARIR